MIMTETLQLNNSALEIIRREDGNIYQRENGVEQMIPIENIRDKYIILLKNSKNYRYMSLERLKKSNNYISITEAKVSREMREQEAEEKKALEDLEKLIVDNLDEESYEYFENKDKIAKLKARNLDIIKLAKEEKAKRDAYPEYRLRKELEMCQKRLEKYLAEKK